MHVNTPNTSAGDELSTSSYERCVHLPDMPCGKQDLASVFDTSQAAARSHHKGGVNVVFGDAHVSFVQDDVDSLVWQAAATIRGNEVKNEL